MPGVNSARNGPREALSEPARSPEDTALSPQSNGVTLGSKIKELRTKRSLSQGELGKLAGLSHSFISRLESDQYGDPGTYTLFKLSRALKVQFIELLKAAGYIKDSKTDSQPQKSVEDVIRELHSVMPITVPILASIDDSPSKAVDYAYWVRRKHEGKDLVGLLVNGFAWEPDIKEGDTIYVWRNHPPKDGNLVLCRKGGEVSIKRYHSGKHEPCDIYGIIITVVRFLP